MNFHLNYFWTVVAALCLAGCGVGSAPPAQAPAAVDGTASLSVVVSIVPQQYFVERVAGAAATVEVLAPPNHTAETHQVTPRQMDILSRADLYFRIGMPFETSLVQRLSATCPTLKIVDTRTGVPMLGAACTHDHDDHAHHHPEGDDPHIWLDPLRVKIQAQAIAAALSEVRPAQAEDFARNLDTFERELDALHARLENILAPARGRIIYVYHPAFAYFADTYGLEQRAVEAEGKAPGPRRLYELIREIKAAGVTTIFDQPQFADGSVQVIAEEAGLKVVALDGLMYDYAAGMTAMAEAIAASFQ